MEGTLLMDHYQEFMQAAQSQTGLHDFGADTFVEGLERLVTALRDEADLNAFGTGALRERILGHLKQRLQVEDWYRRHPEIEEVEIKAPLFGISLPRTGSTALSFLLAEDPKARYLKSETDLKPALDSWPRSRDSTQCALGTFRIQGRFRSVTMPGPRTRTMKIPDRVSL